MGPRLRYTLIQLPECLFVAVALILAYRQDWLEASWALGALALWLAKELALYPLYRQALGEGPPTGAAALVGSSGRAVTALAPEGHVRVGGEHWRAATRNGGEIEAGSAIEVTDFEGLTLVVIALASGDPPSSTESSV